MTILNNDGYLTDHAINTYDVATMIRDHCHLHIMPLFRNLSSEQMRHKDDRGDIVTDADEAMEKHLGASLSEYLPTSRVLGEESYAKNPKVAKILQEDGYVWVMDPLDGTRNFASGSEQFCTMVALMRAGRVIAAWIYLPIADKVIMADIVNGAYDEGGVPLALSPNNVSKDSKEWIGQINFVIFPEEMRDEKRKVAIKNYKKLDKLRCAGIDFAEQVLGLRHFTVYRHLWWWDHIAGIFILKSAGGCVKMLDGGQYCPSARARFFATGISDNITDHVTHFMNDYQ